VVVATREALQVYSKDSLLPLCELPTRAQSPFAVGERWLAFTAPHGQVVDSCVDSVPALQWRHVLTNGAFKLGNQGLQWGEYLWVVVWAWESC
jgi:hypothetical protein